MRSNPRTVDAQAHDSCAAVAVAAVVAVVVVAVAAVAAVDADHSSLASYPSGHYSPCGEPPRRLK